VPSHVCEEYDIGYWRFVGSVKDFWRTGTDEGRIWASILQRHKRPYKYRRWKRDGIEGRTAASRHGVCAVSSFRNLWRWGMSRNSMTHFRTTLIT
jgi:hypothetical protein